MIMRAKMLGEYNCTNCAHGGGENRTWDFLFQNGYCRKMKHDPMPHKNDFSETVCTRFFEHKHNEEGS